MSYSDDEGLTWSYPRAQNFPNNDTTRFPQAVPDGDGNWLAVWQSNENPNDIGFDFDLFYAQAYVPEIASVELQGNALTNND